MNTWIVLNRILGVLIFYNVFAVDVTSLLSALWLEYMQDYIFDYGESTRASARNSAAEDEWTANT